MTLTIARTLLQYLSIENVSVDLQQLSGKVHRAVANRMTFEFYLGENHYFAKLHGQIGWREILKNWLQGRRPITDARPEWQAIQTLQRIGVPTLEAVGFGTHIGSANQKCSFLITKALEQTESLETFCQRWNTSPPPVRLKRHLIQRVADMVRRMHAVPMVHRDCYLCHFLLHLPSLQSSDPRYLQLTLIDLHRAKLLRRMTPRWLIKDLAALYFSSRDIGLTERDTWRFLRHYFPDYSLRQIWRDYRSLLERIHCKAQHLTSKYFTKFPEEARRRCSWPLVAATQLRSIRSQEDLPVSVLLRGSSEVLQCQQLLRYAPGKRLVVRAQWGRRTIVAKFMLHPVKGQCHFAREWRGVQALHQAGIASPRCLYAGKCWQSAMRVFVFEYIPNSLPPDNLLRLSAGREFLAAVMTLQARCHDSGLMQPDCHPHNFLYGPAGLYAIDGSEIVQRASLSKQQVIENLSVLLAQFTFDFAPYLAAAFERYAAARQVKKDLPLWQEMAPALKLEQQKRLHHLSRKFMRRCTSMIEHHSWQQWSLSQKAWSDSALESLRRNPEAAVQAAGVTRLKAGGSATIVKTWLWHSEVVLKRYNIKHFWHGCKRQFRVSRARRSWANAHLMSVMRIPTPEPIFCLERRWGFFVRQSYYLMKYVAGSSLDQYLPMATNEQRQAVLSQCVAIFAQWRQAQIVHSDCKATNFWVSDQLTVFVLDLDGMYHEPKTSAFERAHQKDVDRFLANWSAEPTLLQVCKDLFQQDNA